MKTNNRFYLCSIFYVLGIFLLTACGGGGGGNNEPKATANPVLTLTAVKTFSFSWSDITDATHYKLLENPDGNSGFVQVGGDIAQGTQGIDHVVPLHARLNAQYILQTCNANSCVDSAVVSVTDSLVDSIGYFKASNTGGQDRFGEAISISGDGQTLAVGVSREDSNATGVNGDQNDDSAIDSDTGAVYIFTRSGSDWSQQAYIKASNTEAGDRFGKAVSLSEDGNTLAVGADGEDSKALGSDVFAGVPGVESDNSSLDAGAAYVFSRTGTTWTQQAYIKASNTEEDDRFGETVTLSNDGNTLAVGAPSEDANAMGVNGVDIGGITNSGAAYVFIRSGGSWGQQAWVKASNTGLNDSFGIRVSLSGDGDTLAIGAQGENSSATGINGDETDNLTSFSGAVYVFTRNGVIWSQQAYVKASNTGELDRFGRAISLNNDGSVLAVSAHREDSSATGINGNQTDDLTVDSDTGAVYVFSRSGINWSQQAYLKASNTGMGDQFGWSVSLNKDGNKLAIGARKEDSDTIGINGNQSNDATLDEDSGAVYLFTQTGGSWGQVAYVKASNTGAGDQFGWSISLSTSGDTLAIGAHNEASNATGVGGDSSNDSITKAGAVYVY